MSDHPFEALTEEEFELVSAYADGEATPAEAARVAADARLRAWVPRVHAITSAVATVPVAPAADARDAMIERAVAAADAPEVRSLAAARASRGSWSSARRWLPAVSAAAAVVLLLAVMPVLLRGDNASDTETAAVPREDAPVPTTAPGTGSDDAATAGAGAAVGGAAAATELAAKAVVSGGDLGRYDDVGVLASTARDEFTRRLAASDADAGSPTSPAPAVNAIVAGCLPELASQDGEVAGLRYDATAAVKGDDVGVLVFDLAAPGSTAFRLYVVAPTCTVLTTADF